MVTIDKKGAFHDSQGRYADKPGSGLGGFQLEPTEPQDLSTIEDVVARRSLAAKAGNPNAEHLGTPQYPGSNTGCPETSDLPGETPSERAKRMALGDLRLAMNSPDALESWAYNRNSIVALTDYDGEPRLAVFADAATYLENDPDAFDELDNEMISAYGEDWKDNYDLDDPNEVLYVQTYAKDLDIWTDLKDCDATDFGLMLERIEKHPNFLNQTDMGGRQGLDEIKNQVALKQLEEMQEWANELYEADEWDFENRQPKPLAEYKDGDFADMEVRDTKRWYLEAMEHDFGEEWGSRFDYVANAGLVGEEMNNLVEDEDE